jgi:hypothetical protein
VVSGSTANAVIDVTVVNPSTSGTSVGGLAFTSSGISTVSLQMTSATSGVVTVEFKPPTSLKPATYSDTVRLNLCSDAACANPIQGTTLTIPVTYRVLPYAATNAPTISFSQTAIYAQSPAGATAAPPPTTITITATNFATPPYLAVNQVEGPASIGAQLQGTTPAALLISYPGGTNGALTATFAVTACLDASCINPVLGSPFQISVVYGSDISLSAAGANGYTLQGIPIVAQNMVWDSTHGMLYALIYEGAITPAELVAIDPVTQTIGTPVALNSLATGAMAISDDGQYLYIGLSYDLFVGVPHGEVQRLLLPSLSTDSIIDLGEDADGTQHAVSEIQVAPNAPHTIAAIGYFGVGGSPSYISGQNSVAVFDDAVMRPDFVNQDYLENLQWDSTAASLFGTGPASTSGAAVAGTSLYRMSVATSGISAIQSITDTGADTIGGQMHLAQGLLYLDDGAIYDPATNQFNNTLTNSSGLQALLPDVASGELILYQSPLGNGLAGLQSLNLQQLTATAELQLPSVAPSKPGCTPTGSFPVAVCPPMSPVTWTLWGQDGIAILATGYILFISGNFVGP